MSIRRIRRTPEQKKQDLLKKVLLIPLPWILFALGTSLFSACVGGIGMLIGIAFYRCRYGERLILFQWAFIGFSFCEILFYLIHFQHPLWIQTGWFSGVYLGTFVLVTLLLGRPFTSQIVEDFFPPSMVQGFHFHRINQCISAVWGIHFWISAGISLLPMPSWGKFLLTIFSMFMASLFTKRFPPWYRLYRFIPLHRSGKAPYEPYIEV